MALSKIDAANFLTGTIPQGNVANASLGAVTALPGAIATGKVLQVQSTVGVNIFSTTSTSFVDVTNLSLTITPAATSSKILLLLNTNMYQNTISQYWALGWERAISGGATTFIGNGTYGISFARSAIAHDFWGGVGMTYMDSPSTTSEITYQVQAKASSGTAGVGENSTNQNAIMALEIEG